MLSNFILAAEAEESLGEVMARAGLNTAMGISIVFLSLVFIALIITLEGKIFVAINKKAAAKKTVEKPATPAVVEEVVEDVAVDDNDEEIAAVIMAAIYAYESEAAAEGFEVPADGLVVRSIRRIGYSR